MDKSNGELESEIFIKLNFLNTGVKINELYVLTIIQL